MASCCRAGRWSGDGGNRPQLLFDRGREDAVQLATTAGARADAPGRGVRESWIGRSRTGRRRSTVRRRRAVAAPSSGRK